MYVRTHTYIYIYIYDIYWSPSAIRASPWSRWQKDPKMHADGRDMTVQSMGWRRLEGSFKLYIPFAESSTVNCLWTRLWQSVCVWQSLCLGESLCPCQHVRVRLYDTLIDSVIDFVGMCQEMSECVKKCQTDTLVSVSHTVSLTKSPSLTESLWQSLRLWHSLSDRVSISDRVILSPSPSLTESFWQSPSLTLTESLWQSLRLRQSLTPIYSDGNKSLS